MKLRTKVIITGTVFAILSGGGGSSAVRILESPPSASSGSSGSSVTTVTQHAVEGSNETAFFKTVLEDIGAPDTTADQSSLASWYRHEYPSWPPQAEWNPLDSTLTEPGSTNFNNLSGGGHVQNYPDAATGAKATAATLLNGNYPLIAGALRAGTSLCGGRYADEISTWSGETYSSVC
jgi:hypothetical protein